MPYILTITFLQLNNNTTINIQAQSWQDLPVTQPIDPKAVLFQAGIGVVGTFIRSTNVLQATWGTNPFAFTGNNTKVVSWDTTDASTIADATQWTFNHQMVNASPNIPPSLNKVVFCRAGRTWDNQIEINFGASTYTNVVLTMRDNLGTSGTFSNSGAGSIPVVSLGTTLTGIQILHLTFLQPGVYSMVLVMVSAGVWSTFEMECIVLP